MWLELHKKDEPILVNMDNVLYMTKENRRTRLWIRTFTIYVDEGLEKIKQLINEESYE